jgi:O-antigen/teichoic acid export membrane protein
MRLGQTSAIFFVAKFLGSIIGFVATVVFARFLGEAVLGQYATVLALWSWLVIIGRAGVSESVTKRLSEGEEIEEYGGAGLITIGGVTVFVVLGVLLLREWVNAYIGAPVAGLLAVILLMSVLTVFGTSALQGRHLVHISATLGPLSQLFRGVLQIGLLLAGYGLQAMLIAYALAKLLTSLIAFKYIDFRPALPAKRHFKSLFDFAKFSWLGNIQSRVFGTLDLLLLKYFVASNLVGVYSVAWSIGLILDLFGNAIQSTLFPEMSKVSSEGEIETIERLTEDALAFTGLLLIPGLIGGLIIGDRLLRVYGEGFAIGTDVLVILLCALLVQTYSKQLLSTLNAIDRPDLAFRTNAVFIGTNVILNIILISTYGWVGAAIATLLSSVVGAIISGYYVNEQLNVSLPLGEIGRQWAATVVMGGAVYGTRLITEPYWFTKHNTLYVLFLIAIGGVVYIGALITISSRLRTTVINNVPVTLSK